MNFHLIFGEAIGDYLEKAVLEELERHAPRHTIENTEMFEVGDLMLLSGKCNISLHPVNYTHTDTTYGTISPTGTIVMPSSQRMYIVLSL